SFESISGRHAQLLPKVWQKLGPFAPLAASSPFFAASQTFLAVSQVRPEPRPTAAATLSRVLPASGCGNIFPPCFCALAASYMRLLARSRSPASSSSAYGGGDFVAGFASFLRWKCFHRCYSLPRLVILGSKHTPPRPLPLYRLQLLTSQVGCKIPWSPGGG